MEYFLPAITISSGLLVGFLPALLVRLRLPLSQSLGIPEASLERMRKGYHAAVVPLILAGGWAADRWGARDILFAGFLLAALGIASLGMRLTRRSLAVIALLLGGASACLTPACILLMPSAFWGIEEAAASTNLGFLAVALGYLVLPPLADVFRTRFGFRRGMLILGLFCLLPAFLTIPVSADDFPKPQVLSLKDLWAEPILWLAGSAVFCYFPLLGSLASWTNRYLAELGYDERSSRRWLWVMWVFFLATRLTTGNFLDPRFSAWWILILALLSAVTLGNLAGAYGSSKGWGLLVMGACLGPILPTILGVLLELFDKSPALTAATVYSLGTLGGLVVEPLVEIFAKSHPVRVTIRFPLILALGMVPGALVLTLVFSHG